VQTHWNTGHYWGRPYYNSYRHGYPYTGYRYAYPYASYAYPYSGWGYSSYSYPDVIPYAVPYPVPYTVNNYVPVPVETTPTVPQQTTVIQVLLPSAVAAVQIDGQTIDGTGRTRVIPVADEATTHTVTAIWLAGERMVTTTRTVAVTPGATSVADFTQ